MDMKNRALPQPLEIWIHYRGAEYQIVTLAEHTESNDIMVVYYDVTKPEQVWARPAAMFMGMALTDVPRFKKKDV